jgi:HEAT repeat protein
MGAQPGSMADIDLHFRDLQDADHHARCAAIEALGRSGDPRAVPALLGAIGDRAAGDGEHAVNLRAGLALAALGDLALGPTLAALRPDPAHPDDGWRRYWVARALGLWRDGRAVAPLIAVLDDASPSAVEGAVEALAALRHSVGLGALHDEALAALRRAHARFAVEDGYLPRLLRDTIRAWSRRRGR